MKYLLLILLLMGCGFGVSKAPAHNKPQIDLVIVNKDFTPLLGNSNLFSGLLCASGEKDFCKIAYENISPNGAFCRNKSRVASNGCTDTINSFSADELYGVLLVIIINRDKVLANKLYQYIELSNGRLCQKASDDKCIIYPHHYGLLGKVWKYIGLKPTAKMVAGYYVEGSILRISAGKLEVSYRTHLIAVHLYCNRLMLIWNKDLQATANILLNRQPGNMFMQFLAKGTFSKELFFQRYNERTSKMKQYFIQRSDSEQAWKQSVGWDFQLLKNLYNK